MGKRIEIVTDNPHLPLFFDAWQKLQPGDGKNCCWRSHFEWDEDSKTIVEKPDNRICERELAWRNYVRRRDNNPNFPFNLLN